MRKKTKNTQKRVSTKKKNEVRKEPYKVERKKISTNQRKDFCTARYHTEEGQKNSKSQKSTKMAKCQANAKRRLFKKDVKNTMAIK